MAAANTKKTAAAPESAEAADADVAEPEAPASLVSVRFNWPVAHAVAGMGTCEPGEVREVSEAVAADLCRGDVPLFVRTSE
jgi:hypothetical protein